ncbi:putative transposase [Vibrio parahaemolyticus VPTS-2010]|nr:putative transposase [Vibrio parahaemolyticus VPTS-2010]
MPKPRYKTTNWKQYNKTLISRGSLTFGLMRKRLPSGSKTNKASEVDLADLAT